MAQFREDERDREIAPSSSPVEVVAVDLRAGDVSELVQTLREVSDPSTLAPARDLAARRIVKELDAWGPGVIRRRFATVLRDISPDWVEALIADALQHATTAIFTSRSKVRGRTDAETRSWLRAIILNYVADELRRRARVDHLGDVGDAEGDPAGVDAVVESDAMGLALAEGSMDSLAGAVALLRDLRAHVLRLYRERDAGTSLRSIWVYLGHLAGATTEEQIAIWGGGATKRSADLDKLAQDRVYQMRHRGRRALQRILSANSNSADERDCRVSD
jgi:hypothetical protein